MHLESLKIFCDLAELRSFSKTAEKHLLSQSAISQQLAQMELVHKCQLVDRKKRPIGLTKEGQLLYEAAKDMIDRYEQAKTDLKSLKSSSGAKINVAAIYSIGMHTLPSYVKKFMVKYPKVNVHIEYFNSSRIYEMVLGGDVDIGLVAIPKRNKRLEVYDFDFEPLVLVCSPKNPYSNETKIDIHKIQFERFISFEQEVPTRTWIDGILHQYSVDVRPMMEFDNIETVKRAVEINAGISILPKTAIKQELASGTLKAVDFANENFVRPTGILVRKNKLLGQAGEYFIQLLRREV